ncbi:MAG: type II toxin-antitoxin system HicB family antitoxin [Syntrophomonas sp.]|uniref:type II toxin-antitoxin system HicB family antitoxin n=1 Tax=Syntrophomonas sp. TaxID=2053627 RepID=UPI00262E206C|nr:type II toxin-antitoxin system HicB family antitoxin [Syntrophomonas sp.]MDD4627718.1 type II toxin-antitoxin system HicB family antitoxin [Syntrophomonas sp.]
MKKYSFTILIEKDEDGGYIATVPELKGCHTQGDTMAEIMASIDEAIRLCLEVHEKDRIDVFNQNFVESRQLELVI